MQLPKAELVVYRVCLLDYRHYNFFNLSARGSVDWFVDQCGVLSAGMGVVVATVEVDISGGSTGMRGGGESGGNGVGGFTDEVDGARVNFSSPQTGKRYIDEL